MNVKNHAVIRQLSFKTLWASRKRNIIAIIAIILTSLLFTSLFTVAMSINKSYEMYSFRQLGGYSHGSFQEVTYEQAEAIASHRNVKSSGICLTIGYTNSGAFSKSPAEVSYMDKNCNIWSFSEPTTGRTPKSGKEISMDTFCLDLLGITPKIGAEITLTYTVGDRDVFSYEKTDTFTLVGWWEYDRINPIHYINISEEYADSIIIEGTLAGIERFRLDIPVMMQSSFNIEDQMQEVDGDLGYTWDLESVGAENHVSLNVNSGYTTVRIGEKMDAATLVAIIAFLVLISFTGYLIIYNVFQISVTGDIRFYGLLKTIGVTSRQLKRIVRWQALILCAIGIPVGLLFGYGVGVIFTPIVMAESNLGTAITMISTSPLIFVISALFALVTVLLSCSRPSRIAATVSPVEATKYTESIRSKKKNSSSRNAKIHKMAFANFWQNKIKSIVIILSLALSVALLNVLLGFVGGFNMEKYLTQKICADFIVSSTDYFGNSYNTDQFISEEMITQIETAVKPSFSGCGYKLEGIVLDGQKISPMGWIPEERWLTDMAPYYGSMGNAETLLSLRENRDGLVAEDVLIEGLDETLFSKLTVIEGNLDPLFQNDCNAIAIVVHSDNYGNIEDLGRYPNIGSTQTITYVKDAYYIDNRTGEKASEDTPVEYKKFHIEQSYDVDYTVCAYVIVPDSMGFGHRLMTGYNFVLPAEKMASDSHQEMIPMVYLFDTTDTSSAKAAEVYLTTLTAGSASELMYESKDTIRKQFESFQNMFLILGGALCAIIGIVGILNFFNAIMTGILARQQEFAVLQAVGMTGRQLKTMLVLEGLLYTLGAAFVALVLAVAFNPIIGTTLERMFWFYTAKMTLWPVLATVPVFVILGFLIPFFMYRQTAKYSIVERLRHAE